MMQAAVAASQDCGNGQWLLRLTGEELEAPMAPGTLLAGPEGDAVLMRRHPDGQWIEVLLRAPQTPQNSFQFTIRPAATLAPNPAPQRLIIIGSGQGLAAAIDLADRMQRQQAECELLVLLDSDLPLPLRPHPSRIMINGMPDGVIATVPLLEERHIACRLADERGRPGCFDGKVTELLAAWLKQQQELDQTVLIAYADEEILTALTGQADAHNLTYHGIVPGNASPFNRAAPD